MTPVVTGGNELAQPHAAFDPDPFTIGLGIFGAVAGGGAYLEARRQRAAADRRERDAFRAAWYDCRRAIVRISTARIISTPGSIRESSRNIRRNSPAATTA